MKLLSRLAPALLRASAGGVASGLFALGLAALVALPVLTIPAQAQRSPAPRLFPDQTSAYIRATVNSNSCVMVSLTCSVKLGALPYTSFIVRAYQQVVTTFSGGGVTALTLALGTSVGSGNIVAAQSALTAGNASVLTVVAGGLGTTVTGNGIAQTGTLGGFDIFATLAATTGAPTAGSVVVVLEYIQPNDGSCTVVPTGAVAPGC